MTMEIKNIVSLLRRTYEGGAWHGPSVKEALADVTQKTAFHRLPHTHSIIELVAHMTAWKTSVARRLSGDYLYKVTEEMNFPNPQDWHATVQQLDESQGALLAAIEVFDSGKLDQQVPWTDESFTYYAIIHGIIHHDLYHAGQIVLIKKSAVEQSF